MVAFLSTNKPQSTFWTVSEGNQRTSYFFNVLFLSLPFIFNSPRDDDDDGGTWKRIPRYCPLHSTNQAAESWWPRQEDRPSQSQPPRKLHGKASSGVPILFWSASVGAFLVGGKYETKIIFGHSNTELIPPSYSTWWLWISFKKKCRFSLWYKQMTGLGCGGCPTVTTRRCCFVFDEPSSNNIIIFVVFFQKFIWYANWDPQRWILEYIIGMECFGMSDCYCYLFLQHWQQFSEQ